MTTDEAKRNIETAIAEAYSAWRALQLTDPRRQRTDVTTAIRVLKIARYALQLAADTLKEE